MPKTFMPEFKDIEALKQHQLKGLQWTVAHAYQGSDFYRKKLDDAGVGSDGIQSLNDLQSLPFTTADDLRDGYPFPLLSVPESQVVRIHASSGTTGKRKILEYMRHPVLPANVKFCHILRRISTIGYIFLPDAMSWPV
jgi:phenylacetate-CoA ligase